MNIFIQVLLVFLGQFSRLLYNKNYQVSELIIFVGGDLENVDKRVNFTKGDCENISG